MHKVSFFVLGVSALVSHSVMAKDELNIPPPGVYQELMQCRSIADEQTRLACFDRQSAALENATRNHEILISDKETVQAARRGLFGFAAPIGRLMGFGANDDDKNEIKEIQTSVKGVRRTSNGWRLEFADGSTWEQNDTRDFALSPKIGNDARITRGALGTFLVSVRGQRSIKMRRVN